MNTRTNTNLKYFWQPNYKELELQMPVLENTTKKGIQGALMQFYVFNLLQ